LLTSESPDKSGRIAESWLNHVRWALATGLWFGCSPIIPGTVGSLPAVAVFVVIMTAAPPEVHALLIAAALIVTCVLAVPLGDWAERYWNKHDPRNFVMDEIAGFFLTVLLFRVESLVWTTIWAFVATRAFDIIKPPPARAMERLPGGWGILLDDLVASLYAAASLHVAAFIVPGFFGR
jgi:phosphatidylglycerophosphatase A